MTSESRLQTSINLQRKPISPKQLVSVKLVSDFILTLFTLYFALPIIQELSGQIIFAGILAIFISSIIGFFLIRKERVILGMGFVIYGMIIGLGATSIFVVGLGPFTLVALVLITSLMVSNAIPRPRAIEAIFVSVIVGAASMAFDITNKNTLFRLEPTPELPIILWGITLVLIAVFLFLIFRQFPYLSIQAKLIFSFTVVTVFSLSLLGILNNLNIRNVLSQEADKALYNAAEQTQNQINQFVNTNLLNVTTQANLPVFINYLSSSQSERESQTNQVENTLSVLAAQDPENIISYALLDLNGKILLDSNSKNIGKSEADISAFTDPIEQGKAVISNVEMDPGTDQPTIYFSAPVIEDSHIIIGVLRVQFNATILQSIIEESNHQAGENSFAVLFDDQFLQIAHGTQPENIFMPIMPMDQESIEMLKSQRRIPQDASMESSHSMPILEESLADAAASNSGILLFDTNEFSPDDQTNRVVVINLKNTSWLMAFFQPKETYLAPVTGLTNNTILLSLASGFGAVLIAVLLTQVLIAPINNLNQSAIEITNGNLEARVKVNTNDEIGDLGISFNRMAEQLKSFITNLESQVSERTRELQNRTAKLQAAAEIARDATSEQELQQLLDRTTTLILERFGFYHVGIYLIDQSNNFGILTSCSDELGKSLLAESYKVSIDAESNVGYVFILGESRKATSEDPRTNLIVHPIFSNAQAQLTLPINVNNKVIGVIDILSINPLAFSEEDVQIFQTLTDQIAHAIQKTEYLGELQTSLNELEKAYGVYTKNTWENFVKKRESHTGYRYNKKLVEPVFTSPPQVDIAWQSGEVISEQNESASTDNANILAIPMKIRGEVIGVLNIEFEEGQIPTDTTKLIEDIAERLSLVLENARLIDTAQTQVQQEQLTSYISNTIRQTMDIESVLRTAVQEIGNNLGLSEVEIRVGTSPQNGSSPTTNGRSNGKNDSEVNHV